MDYLESTAKSEATQADADRLAEDANASWWDRNKNRFVR